MFKILGILIAGVLIGRCFQENKHINEYIGKLITVTIFALLFLLGVSIGIDKQILNALPTLGLTALLLTIGGVGGSIICASFLYKWYYKNKQKQD